MMCTQSFGAGMAGGPRNAPYNMQGGAFKASPLLPVPSWTHIEVGGLDPSVPPPQPHRHGRPRYSAGTGMAGVSPRLTEGEALLWGKTLLSHLSSLPATSPTSQSTGGFTNKRESKPGLRQGRESQHGSARGFAAGKASSPPVPPPQPRRDGVGQGRGLLLLH